MVNELKINWDQFYTDSFNKNFSIKSKIHHLLRLFFITNLLMRF